MRERILFVTGEYPPMMGGIGDYTHRLIESLENLGWPSHVLTGTAARESPDPRVLTRINRWDWHLAGEIRKALHETSSGIVHIQYQTGAFQMHPAINLLPYRWGRSPRRVPLVTTFHDLLPPYLFPKAGRLRGRVTRMLASGSDAVIATNPEDLQTLRRYPGVAARSRQIPIGSNLPDGPPDPGRERMRAAARDRLRIAGDELAIGFFGFLTEDKGVDLLVESMSLLARRRMNPHLVIIGGGLAATDRANANYRSRLRDTLAAASFPVTQTGHLADIEAACLLSGVDLIVLPFRSGASLRRGTLIAALRAGVAVLTTASGTNGSIGPFVAGESIWLVPPGDREALADAMQHLLSNPALRVRLASNALREAAAFDWSAIAQQHVELYTELLERRNAATKLN